MKSIFEYFNRFATDILVSEYVRPFPRPGDGPDQRIWILTRLPHCDSALRHRACVVRDRSRHSARAPWPPSTL